MVAETDELLAGIESLDLERGHVGEQHAAHGRGMRGQPAAGANVARERRIGRAAHEIEHVGPVQHAEMGRELQALGKPGHDWDRDLHQVL